ncbi:aminoacyltransferase [Bifidobacterium cuniculi]|uniref:FemAB-like protein n=1 Tax=Bifidobacterium cuniculi TaxID=1688 RepID=A0A087AWR9_9BIFI|nr:aminoacyltransferase [Bifidobacterium cuniculi]KFI63219.1 FemAB-like protein [Bifidobacterium cuniculi]
MRQFSCTLLTAEEFAAFAARAPHGNFQQTTMMGDLRAGDGTQVDYIGVRERGRLVAAALLCTVKSAVSAFSAVYDGPLCDLDDRELTVYLMDALAAFARKQRGAVHLDVTPEQPYRLRDGDGEATDGDPDQAMMDNLAAARMEHQGFTRGYTAVPRWRFVKDLDGIADGTQLLKSFSKRTQWSVKRAKSMGVEVRSIGLDELDTFARIEQDTAERRHFAYRGEEYFRRFAQAFGDDAHFLVAQIDTARGVDAMERKVAGQQAKVDTLTAKIERHDTTKLRRQLAEESSNLKAAHKRLDEARALAAKGDIIPVAASMFVTVPQETVYLFSGSVEEYKPYYASALIQYEAMLRYCVERGVPRYNFYGIDGVFDDPDSEGRGVLEFKQGFNGRVEELPGEFIRVLRPGRYRLLQLAHGVVDRVRR